ncbi:hypothetical protein Kirov_235 [Bacillus phage Kirov]|uniref:Uncharacterized protein n=1 Tax=Bacillus phage Kirov TaxID=2783539 RepID=A0A7U3NK07_9CAUD|nr:hypothetical protein PQE67_gp069 [Bacillus phage Kirov]QOV08434.1 hypothetical protein Kirov_235 [Bacillus phage Kirov]
MRYVYVLFTKDDYGRVTIEGAFTSHSKMWEKRDELYRDDNLVCFEKLPLNEETSILLNVWSKQG